MKVFGRDILDKFVKKHAQARGPVLRWVRIVQRVDWKSPHDIKQTFGSTDFIGDQRAIFNLGGNKYRLVVEVRFRNGMCLIEWIGTHAEYSKRQL